MGNNCLATTALILLPRLVLSWAWIRARSLLVCVSTSWSWIKLVECVFPHFVFGQRGTARPAATLWATPAEVVSAHRVCWTPWIKCSHAGGTAMPARNWFHAVFHAGTITMLLLLRFFQQQQIFLFVSTTPQQGFTRSPLSLPKSKCQCLRSCSARWPQAPVSWASVR